VILNYQKIIPWIRLLRIYQWVKNLLIFTPLIAIKKFNFETLYYNLEIFFIFSLFVSTTYIINDLIDIEEDRKHPQKKKRPLASGEIRGKNAKYFCFVSIVFLLSIIFYNYSINIILYFILYLLMSIFYSKLAKKIIFFDLIFLVLFYLLRIFLGGEYNNIEISYWLISLSFFIFLTLGTIKRASELNNYSFSRKYQKNHLKYLLIIAFICSIISTIILILYISSTNFKKFHNDNDLFNLIPIILFIWLLRVNYLSYKKKMIDDPILFLLKDKISYLSIIISLIIMLV
jgi:4-hydroxybenzoate polyprenyltransferase